MAPISSPTTPPPPHLCGVMAPVLTPFNADLTPSPARLVQHCRWRNSLHMPGIGLLRAAVSR